METAEQILYRCLKEANCLWDEGYEHEFHATNTPNKILESAMQEYAQQIASLAWDAGRVYGAKDFIDKNKLQQRFLWAGEQPPTKEQFLNSIFNKP